MYLIRTPNAVDAVSGAGSGLATETGGASRALPAADQGRLTGFPSTFPPAVLGRSISICSTAAECLGERPAARGFPDRPAVLHATPATDLSVCL